MAGEARRHAVCFWTGWTAEGAEVECGRAATFYVQPVGRARIYCCPEHLAGAKARASDGHVVHEIHRPVLGAGSFTTVEV